MLGGLHDPILGVETGSAGAPGNLVELPRRQQTSGGPVVLGQAGKEHGADRHVDPDSEGVSAADDLEQTAWARRSTRRR